MSTNGRGELAGGEAGGHALAQVLRVGQEQLDAADAPAESLDQLPRPAEAVAGRLVVGGDHVDVPVGATRGRAAARAARAAAA